MTIHLDTSTLVGALTEPHHQLARLIELVDDGHRVVLSSVVLYEWLRGPREPGELRMQEALFPREAAIPFDSDAAARAAALYRALPRARSRHLDLAIGACAVAQRAAVWTLNPGDFRDIPGLKLV